MTFDEETQKGLDLQRGIAYDVMGTALSRGLPILETLNVGAACCYDNKLKHAFGVIREGIRQGDSIMNAMRKTGFPFYDYEYEGIDNGEIHGEVDVALQGLAKRLNPTP